MIATPQGSRPTGADFSAFKVATSMTVMSLVRPLAPGQHQVVAVVATARGSQQAIRDGALA
jgi:hypothetical protein